MTPLYILLQILAVIVVPVLITLLADMGLWRRVAGWLPPRPAAPQEEAKGAAGPRPWYWERPVETGVLEVALAFTAAAMALPAFIGPQNAAAPLLLWSFQGVLLAAASLAAMCSLWLFRIYVRQSMCGASGASRPSGSAGSIFSLRAAGPYALLAYAMILLLVGLSLLPVIVAQ